MNAKDEGNVPAAPADFAALRQMMLDERRKLPKRISQVAAYSLDNPDEIAFGTAASVAASAGVQPSTLIRFARFFGFDGFTSLQSVFRERLRDRNLSYDERLTSLSNLDVAEHSADVLKGLMEASVRSINTLAGSIDKNRFEKSVDILSKSRVIYIVARRRSFPVASYLAYTLGKLGIWNILIDSAVGLAPETVSFASKEDAMIAVSFSPYSQETAAHAKSLSERGVPVVGITDSAFSPLSEYATVWFDVVEADYGGFRSLSASLALAGALAIRIAEVRRQTDKE
ncbi:MAG: MurR/RpiR family transcriptional regulator [Rhizobiales bacterium]|nr:MurR/RpiR family transcriptional regulator [Hyphomicrobiales bacterium]